MTEIKGIITALVTPMRDGAVDDKGLEALVNWQIAEGIHGLVPCGTTGESATLSHEEHMHVVKRVSEIAAGRVPVIAGAGSNATDEAILLAKSAQASGAQALLSVTPYYNKPSEEGMYAHFKAVHDACDLPIILYNIPGRSIVDMSDDLIARLAELPRIVGVKDATGNLARVSTLRDKAGAGFIQLSGEDMTAIGFNAMGGVGCISVTSNVMPAALSKLQAATLKGDFEAALAIQDGLVAMHEAMFCAPSPAPAKYALSRLGKISPELRLPILPLNEVQKQQVDSAMAGAGLL
jgi:4-hydroxy-tetrahydrodipicolinate synthase